MFLIRLETRSRQTLTSSNISQTSTPNFSPNPCSFAHQPNKPTKHSSFTESMRTFPIENDN